MSKNRNVSSITTNLYGFEGTILCFIQIGGNDSYKLTIAISFNQGLLKKVLDF